MKPDVGQTLPSDAQFLLDVAAYFEARPTGGEDSAHWANVYNAEHCRRIAEALSRLSTEGVKAIGDIEAERRRQVATEGWTSKHDDAHPEGQLARAAACYALGGYAERLLKGKFMERVWPWDEYWWKPGPDRRRQLVKAGALIVAEIERLDRAQVQP